MQRTLLGQGCGRRSEDQDGRIIVPQDKQHVGNQCLSNEDHNGRVQVNGVRRAAQGRMGEVLKLIGLADQKGHVADGTFTVA